MTGHWLATFPHPCCRFGTLCVVGNKVPCEGLAGGGGSMWRAWYSLPRIQEATKSLFEL